MDLLERIKLANKKSEENNRKSAQAQAQHNLLTEQISEKVSEYEQEFGISFPNIEDEAKFSEFLTKQLSLVEEELTKKVELAEKVNQLIMEGDIEGAQRLLGYDYSEHNGQVEEPSTLEEDEEDSVEEVEDVEDASQPYESEDTEVTDELEEEVVKPVSKVIVQDLDDLDDLDEVAPIKSPRASKVVETSDFDMGDSEDVTVSLKDITSVAKVTPKRNSPIDLDSLDEEQVPTSNGSKPKPTRKVINIDEDDDDDDFVVPNRPIRSGGSFKFD